jgi:hypothetical protein
MVELGKILFGLALGDPLSCPPLGVPLAVDDTGSVAGSLPAVGADGALVSSP